LFRVSRVVKTGPDFSPASNAAALSNGRRGARLSVDMSNTVC